MSFNIAYARKIITINILTFPSPPSFLWLLHAPYALTNYPSLPHSHVTIDLLSVTTDPYAFSRALHRWNHTIDPILQSRFLHSA